MAQHVDTETATSPARAGSSDPWRDLYSRATKKTRAVYPGMRLVTAFGYAPDGPTEDMSRFTHWIFIYGTPPSPVETAPDLGAYIEAELGGAVGEPRKGHGAWLGNMPVEGPRLTPADAFEAIKRAGKAHPFQYISLDNPLDPALEQRYILANRSAGPDQWVVHDADGKVYDLTKGDPDHHTA
ncbi:hypothetical protein [Streptomyces sp. SP18CS02]|uniref:hypothetical protein n=1 Tax=Streptomyces sp. SP18CS02 TaxID=3002531 RepID=UPI002E767446|nr:hypothetical protein [Streptomyces sp. SP18CS02]MEE1753124.1 hypothetical protein [Streptomyces sp. SP18CS02]